MGLISLHIQDLQGMVKRATVVAAHDLSAEDPLDIIAHGEFGTIDPMEHHIFYQHGHVAHAPGHIGKFVAAPG